MVPLSVAPSRLGGRSHQLFEPEQMESEETYEQIGLLLINVGSPQAPTPVALRRYLRQFLSDPYVLPLHPLLRWPLVNLLIVPRRARRSAELYKRIWTDAGPPLTVHACELAAELQRRLGRRWRVQPAMRYGQPSIEAALERLLASGLHRLVLFPLYPQYSAPTTGSALAAAYRALAGRWHALPLSVVPPFGLEPAVLDAYAAIAREALGGEPAGWHLLFSFHGVTEKHLRRSDRTGRHCLRSEHCCDQLSAANRLCYRAQCLAMARALAERLGLPAGQWSIGFQSRVGPGRWIGPETAAVAARLAESGQRRLAVLCPSFVADCLETLEEIGIRLRELFLARGGREFVLVPSLNRHPAWVEAATALARRAAGQPP